MRRLLPAMVAALALPHVAAAQDWISLGGAAGPMSFEMNTSSVESRGGDETSAWIRGVGAAPQGQLTLHMLVVAHCGQGLIEIERGIMESDWSPRIVEMPEPPPQDRIMALPAENPAFNNLYSYICR